MAGSTCKVTKVLLMLRYITLSVRKETDCLQSDFAPLKMYQKPFVIMVITANALALPLFTVNAAHVL